MTVDSLPEKKPLEVVVVTGLSGAGKTTAVNALEDLGYFCVDNLPPPVVAATVDSLLLASQQRIAFGIDVRVGGYLASAQTVLDELAARADVALSILFLDASEELLSRRFKATRRPHPLTRAGGPTSLVDGLRLERELLAPLCARASAVIDTSNITVHELRRRVIAQFAGNLEGRSMQVRVVSFGFKYGSPHDADLLFDVRFLPNPFFVPELRDGSGLDASVSSYVLGEPDAQEFLKRALPLLSFCLPRYQAEGKSYVTIAIGCTGGRHRSVALAERTARLLREEVGGQIEAAHRDILRHEALPPE